MFYVGLLGNVFSKPLAYYLFITFSIEQVVSDLKCKTERFSIPRELPHFLDCSLACQGPNPHCRSNECGGLVAVYIVKDTFCSFLPVVEHIHDLSCNHPLCAGCPGYFVKHLPGNGR